MVPLTKSTVTVITGAVGLVLSAALPTAAQSGPGVCRQALTLGLDASLSVDPHEFKLQREGLAGALRDPEVIDAVIGSSNSHIMFAVFDWSGPYDQRNIIDWVAMDTRETLFRVANQIEQAEQLARIGKTGLGAAMVYAQEMLASQAQCASLTLDISGDGENNSGVAPEDVRDRLNIAGITVNGLVIEQGGNFAGREDATAASLTRYYRRNVIAGPLAFTETIYGFDDYQEAMKRKLLRELFPAFAWKRD